jgi:hypothetical protein
MKRVGTLEQWPALAAIVAGIFEKKSNFKLPDGTTLRTSVFKGTLFAVDYRGLRYVEQNPETSTEYAERARRGARIVQVYRTHRRVVDAAGQEQLVPCSEYAGRVEGSDVFM